MIKKTILFFTLVITSVTYGQQNIATPYSFFGMGINYLGKTVEENSMGGVGTALSIPGTLNFSNPAALSGIRFTTYSLATTYLSTEVTDQNNTQKSSVFSLSYLGLGIPLGSKGGMSAGLKGYSGVGYTLFGENPDNNNPMTFTGEGGTSSLFLSGGYQIAKGLSLGAEAAFVFGKIQHVVLEQDGSVTYSTRETASTSLRGLDTKLGLLYQKTIGETNSLNAGLTLRNSNKIYAREESVLAKGFFGQNTENVKQTLDPYTVDGDVENPYNLTGALAYGKRGVWQTSVEYSFNKPQKYNGATFISNTRNVTYKDYSRVSVGGYYIPKFNSLTNYFHRVVYRYGFKYENTGIQLTNDKGVSEDLTDLGISFGVGLPLGSGLTRFNIGAEYGIKGRVSEVLVQEKYLNVRMSLTLGDRWFRKRRID